MNRFITVYRKYHGNIEKNSLYENNLFYLFANPQKQLTLQVELFKRQRNSEVEKIRKETVLWFYISVSLFLSAFTISYFFIP